jgi:hypothetical protein
MDERLISILEEQYSVGFTGRVNVLNSTTKQLLGEIIIFDGQIVFCKYKGVEALKAFFNICVDEYEGESLTFIVEPELFDITKRHIHYPFGVLKRKISEVIENYSASKANRPPDHIKILIKPGFMADGEVVSGEEFDLLCTLSDYNLVSDVYKNCQLIDFEITNALVSLRKKDALTVVAKK